MAFFGTVPAEIIGLNYVILSVLLQLPEPSFKHVLIANVEISIRFCDRCGSHRVRKVTVGQWGTALRWTLTGEITRLTNENGLVGKEWRNRRGRDVRERETGNR